MKPHNCVQIIYIWKEYLILYNSVQKTLKKFSETTAQKM